MADAAELAHWRRRALRAEEAVCRILWMHPLGDRSFGLHLETAEGMKKRLRSHMESQYPDLVVRYEHQRIKVFQPAEHCDCPEDAEDYEEWHSSTAEDGQYMCERTMIGYVCASCEDKDETGPDWLPDAVEWPCPPIQALNQITVRSAP